jgi:hypothetical protein
MNLVQTYFIDHVLTYAKSGIFCFPVHDFSAGVCSCGNPRCKRPAKHPRTANGLKDATTDEKTLRTWWELWPQASIGINCGMSDLIVVDVDVKKGALGFETMKPLMEQFPEPFSLAPITSTPSGGRHIWFQGKTRSGQGVIGPGVDVRSEGGYVIAPPSIGEGGSYDWQTRDRRPILPMPPELLKLFGGRSAVGTSETGFTLGDVVSTEREPGARESIPLGEHRAAIIKYAWHLRRVQGLSAKAAWPLVKTYASSVDLMEGLDPDRPFSNADLYKMLTEEPANAATPAVLTTEFIRGDHIEAAIKPTNWFIKGFVPEGELMLLYGKSTAGKSTWFAWLAARITQTGRNFGFIGSEDKCGVFFEKARRCGADMSKLYTAKGSMRGLYLDNSEFLNRLIDEWGLSFLYFDKIYKHFPSSGNDARTATQATLDPAMEVAQQRLCTIAGTLHPNKADTYSGSTEMVNIPRLFLKATAYGKNDIGMYVDAEYSNLKKPTDKDGNEVKMAFEKNVYPIFGADGLPMMETTYAPEGTTKDIFETYVWKRVADVPKNKTTLGEAAGDDPRGKEMHPFWSEISMDLTCNPNVSANTLHKKYKGNTKKFFEEVARQKAERGIISKED